MAATVTKLTGQQGSRLRGLLARGAHVWIGTVLFDDSYPTGGESVSLPFTPEFVIAEPAGGYVFTWDYTNEKLLAYYYDYDGAADAVAIQVAAAVDMATITTRVLAIKV